MIILYLPGKFLREMHFIFIKVDCVLSYSEGKNGP